MSTSTNLKYNFAQKNVVVTGGASGIGFELCKNFLLAGANVAIWDFSDANLAAAQTELSSFKGQFSVSKVDVGSEASVKDAAAKLSFAVDVLVNNAGITRDKSLVKMSGEEFDAVIATNLKGVFNVTKTLLEKFNPQSKDRRIVNIASVVALYGNFGQTNYVAAKAGVIGMTKTWARELARKGFTVNAVAPGFTWTPMVQAMPDTARKVIEDKIPVGRFGRPEDIANACMFLASNEASYINGATISVDGGLVV